MVGSEFTFDESTGNFTATGTVTSGSDISLKTNITNIENALDRLCQLRGIEFDYIRTGEHNYGLIAQEVEEIFPYLIRGVDPKSVAYANITAILIEAVKELKKEVEELKKKIVE